MNDLTIIDLVRGVAAGVSQWLPDLVREVVRELEIRRTCRDVLASLQLAPQHHAHFGRWLDWEETRDGEWRAPRRGDAGDVELDLRIRRLACDLVVVLVAAVRTRDLAATLARLA